MNTCKYQICIFFSKLGGMYPKSIGKVGRYTVASAATKMMIYTPIMRVIIYGMSALRCTIVKYHNRVFIIIQGITHKMTSKQPFALVTIVSTNYDFYLFHIILLWPRGLLAPWVVIYYQVTSSFSLVVKVGLLITKLG